MLKMHPGTTQTTPSTNDLRPLAPIPRILVVDAHDDTRELYRQTFQRCGCDVVEASDGRDALTKALVSPPSLIVTEITLPFLDGFALCELLRRDRTTADIPILVVTAAPPADMYRARRAGADIVVAKPTTPDHIVSLSRRLLDEVKDLRGQAAATEARAAVPSEISESALAHFDCPVVRGDAGILEPAAAQATLADETTAPLVGNDLESIADLYDRHAGHVFSLAMRIVREIGAAEDVVQEVFLQAWTQRRRYDPTRGPVGAWLLMLTRSRSIDRIRAARRDGSQSAGGCDCSTVAAPRRANVEDTRLIRDALTMLPTEHRRLVGLAFYDGYTHSEIAVLLQQPLGTVKTRIRRAMLGLRTAIDKPRPWVPTV